MQEEWTVVAVTCLPQESLPCVKYLCNICITDANICLIVEIYIVLEMSHGLLNNKDFLIHSLNQTLQTLEFEVSPSYQWTS